MTGRGTTRPGCHVHRPDAVHIVLHPGDAALTNIGDTAMLLVALDRFRRLWPEACISVPCSNPDELLRRDPGLHVLDPVAVKACYFEFAFVRSDRPPPRLARAVIVIARRLRRSSPRVARQIAVLAARSRGVARTAVETYIDTSRRADLVALSGGGYVADAFRRNAFRALEVLADAHERGAVTAALSQGLGPVTETALGERLRKVLSRVDVVLLREQVHGVSLVGEGSYEVTGDDAVAIGVMRSTSPPGRYFGVNIRVAPYAGMPPGLAAEVGQELLKTLHELGAVPSVVPVSRHAGEDDATAVLRALGPGLAAERTPSPRRPEDLVAALADCRALMTGSYHAAVFALSMGVPVVALVASSYYENKFTGVAAQFGGGCRVVDLRGEWRDALTCAVEDAWNAGVSRREALLAAAWRQVAAAEEGYERLFSVVASAGSGNHGDQPAVRRWR